MANALPLPKYHRIYLVLRELEMPRWTERERNGLMNELRAQIERLLPAAPAKPAKP